jgi:GNAT superfamily N-acetyltransferase
MAKLTCVPVKELTQREVNECKQLVLPVGMMKARLDYCLENPMGSHVAMLRVGAELVGWALMFHTGPRQRTLYFFVREDHRRKGYGTILANAVLERHGKKNKWGEPRNRIRVVPWDTTSEGFFQKFPDFICHLHKGN